jgi:hypothetical protein
VQAWRRTWALRPDLRPRRSLPATTAIHVAIAGRALSGDLVPEFQALAALPEAPGLVVLGAAPRALGPDVQRCRDLKDLRRAVRRRHGAAPQLVAVAQGPVSEATLPVARSAAALLDLLALLGDLSAPIVLLPATPPAPLGDLTPAGVPDDAGMQRPSGWPEGAIAVFALDAAEVASAALYLARTPSMIDSSPPQPVCGSAISLAAAALRELRSPAAR